MLILWRDSSPEERTGLDCFGARFFDSAPGRFTTVDPLSTLPVMRHPQSLNGYAYARNNPLRYVDPTGLAEAEAVGIEEIKVIGTPSSAFPPDAPAADYAPITFTPVSITGPASGGTGMAGVGAAGSGGASAAGRTARKDSRDCPRSRSSAARGGAIETLHDADTDALEELLSHPLLGPLVGALDWSPTPIKINFPGADPETLMNQGGAYIFCGSGACAIDVDPSLVVALRSDLTYVAVLAHELGHAFDHLMNRTLPGAETMDETTPLEWEHMFLDGGYPW